MSDEKTLDDLVRNEYMVATDQVVVFGCMVVYGYVVGFGSKIARNVNCQ